MFPVDPLPPLRFRLLSTFTMQPSSSTSPPLSIPSRPNPFRFWAVFFTVLGAIGTGMTIVGGGILLSFYKLTVQDEHTRRTAGISVTVLGALLIPPSIVIGLYDAYRLFRWYRFMRAHPEEKAKYKEEQEREKRETKERRLAARSGVGMTQHANSAV